MAGPADRARDRGLKVGFGLAIIAIVLAGCRERSDSAGAGEAVTVEAKPSLEVGIAGCSALIGGPERVCLQRKPRPLHLWLDEVVDPGLEVSISFDGEALAHERIADPDGLLLRVEPPQGRGRLELEASGGAWGIELVEVSPAFEAARAAAVAHSKAGDSQAAQGRIDAELPKLPVRERGMLGCLAAKLAMAERDFDRLAALAGPIAEAGDLACVGEHALLLAYAHTYLQPDFNAVEQHLRAAEAVQAQDLDTRIHAAYFRGVLEHRLGQIDESLLGFERAARLARRVGDDGQYASALVMQAVSLARLGRFAEAEALAAEVERRAAEIRDAGLALEIRSSVAWISVLRREDDPSLADPSAELRTLVDAYASREDRRNLANRRLDLALTLVQNGALEAAERELQALEPGLLDPDLLVWFELTAARIALLRGGFERADASLARARVLAELNQDRELQWHVTLTAAELARARGDDAAAIDRYREASMIADELALAIAGDAGRSRFVTTHSRADLALVELLLDRGDPQAAICTAMRARARHLRGLWARLRPPLSPEHELRYRELLSRYHEQKQALAVRLERSWELSTAQLEALEGQLAAQGERADQMLAEATALLEDGAPVWSCERSLPGAAGQAVLTMAPDLGGRAWIGMLAWRRGDGEIAVEVARVDAGDVVVAAAELLERFAAGIEANPSLRVVPVGEFVSVDFHRLWRARSTVELALSYSLGLGSAAADNQQHEPRAAVVAGSDDLAAVAREVAVVGERLRGAGWSVEAGWSPTATAQPALLHYAGHGFDGGELGWQSAIELPELGRLTAAGVVAGQRSPELVVLGACSTGRTRADSIDGGMNLAAAFLLAGARLVIAPTRDVDDQAALNLAGGLYREVDASNPADPDALVRGLARLQREQVETGEGPRDFGSWRAWVP